MDMRPFSRLAAGIAGIAVVAALARHGRIGPERSRARPQAAPAAQAAPADSRFEGKVDVNEVLLDVLVTDRRATSSSASTRTTSWSREDGKPVDLTGVTFYSNRRFLESAEERARKGINVDRVPEDRYFILFFEDQKTTRSTPRSCSRSSIEAGRQARDWVKSGDVLPSDWVAVVELRQQAQGPAGLHPRPQGPAGGDRPGHQGQGPGRNWPSRIKENRSDGPSLLAGLPRATSCATRRRPSTRRCRCSPTPPARSPAARTCCSSPPASGASTTSASTRRTRGTTRRRCRR